MRVPGGGWVSSFFSRLHAGRLRQQVPDNLPTMLGAISFAASVVLCAFTFLMGRIAGMAESAAAALPAACWIAPMILGLVLIGLGLMVDRFDEQNIRKQLKNKRR